MKKSKKDRRIQIRFTEEQRRKIDEVANREHMPMSTFIRSKIMKLVDKRLREHEPNNHAA